MFTIAVVVFGLTVVNWHFDVVAEIAKKSQAVAKLINEALQGILPVPLEWQPAYNFVRLDVKFGADASIIAPGSRPATLVATGTVVTQSVHPDVQPALSSPVPGDLDDSSEPDISNETPVPADVMSTEETPLQKALETNKAGK